MKSISKLLAIFCSFSSFYSDFLEMHISVKTWDDTTIVLDVEPTDTVASVKTKVCYNGFHLRKFDLAFDCEKLFDDRTLNDYNIGIESMLIMIPLICWIRPWDGKPKIGLKVMPWDTIENVKKMIQYRSGILS